MDKNTLFNEVLSQNKDRIYRICCGFERDPDERNDLFQKILVNIWKNLDKFEGRSLISTWIYRIAVNTSLLHQKTEAKRKINHVNIDENTLSIPESDRDKEEKLALASQTESLYANINLLPELDRLIISMVLDDLSYKEISDVTGLTVSNVGVKINRIKKALLKSMGDYNYGT